MNAAQIISWKPSGETGETGGTGEMDKPDKAQTAEKPVEKQEKPKKQRKPSAPKAKSGKKGRLGTSMLGWFIETVPVFDKDDGSIGSDLSKRVNIPVPNAKGVGDVMKKFRDIAATSPDTVSHHCVRFYKAEKVFITKIRQIVDIEE